jgi:UDP-glucuronate 4-epimerase
VRSALITGGAGFIGSHLTHSLLGDGWQVDVLDNFDTFYDPVIKRGHVAGHRQNPAFRLIEADIRDIEALNNLTAESYDVLIHLAARAGVRPSILDPMLYQDVNVRGTQNLLEFARKRKIPQFVFASSSSVYGLNANVPWSEDDHVLCPISPYASTKVSGELLGHVYAHLYGIRFIGLRFFTVYGPRQRPDLAIHRFARNLLRDEPILLFGDGSSRRDYSFVSDIVAGICAAMAYTATGYEIVNLGAGAPVTLLEMIRTLEQVLDVRARMQNMPEQPGDVPQTYASIEKARALLGYSPRVKFAEGVAYFVEWLRASQEAAQARGAPGDRRRC